MRQLRRAISGYSPRAFKYSSKLSLEIIFQYPFRSTGMLDAFLLVSLLPVNDGGPLWTAD